HQKRLLAHARTLFRRDDVSAALPLGTIDPLALPFETYKLAFTPGLVTQIYEGRVTDPMLANEAHYVHTRDEAGVEDSSWWIPSGRVFYSPTAAGELAHARAHFFLVHRSQDPFGAEAFVTYDTYDLLPQETRDALGSRMTAGERDLADALAVQGNDYRVLK